MMHRMKTNKTARWLRWGLLAFLLVWLTYESIMHQLLGGGKSPSIHALCPYGALESLYALLISGSLIQKIYSGTFILLAITVAIAILFRRSFCGLLCPFGALQELFAKIGKKVFKKRPTIRAVADKYLRYLKYLILILTVVLAWRLGRLWMSPFDPYAAYGHVTVIAATLAEDPLTIIGFILLAISLIGSFVYDRFFCKYLCPAGAFYAVIGKVSPTHVKRNQDICINCNLCTKVCPVNLDVAKMDRVTSAECLNCNECVNVCPKKGAVVVKTGKRTVSTIAMLVLVVVLFFAPIFIAQAAGVYEVLPESVKAGDSIPISEIKGYMSIQDAALATGYSVNALRTLLGIPVSVPEVTQMKAISAIIPGFDFDAAKEKAEELTGAGSTAASSSSAPGATGSATQTTAVVPNASGKIDISGIKGSMTISAAAAAIGLDQTQFYKLFQIPATVSSATIMKDIGNIVPGYSFDTIKTSLG
jgi:polyferredoxin